MSNTANRTWLSLFIFLACLLTFTPAWADGPEDDYLRIYGMIDDADSLSAKGKDDLAQSKYAEAQKELLAFKKSNPTWNTKTVGYRINYLAEKLAPKAGVTGPQADSTPATAAPAPAQVKLLDAGSEPRVVLRLHPKTGDTQSVKMTMQMSMEVAAEGMEMPAMKMPPMEFATELTVKNVAPNGDITYETLITEAGIGGDSDSTDPMTAASAAQMSKIKGISGTGVVTDRGISKSVDFKMPRGGDAATRQTLDQMKDAFSQVTFPMEAVGVGAKWEINSKKKSQGMTIDQSENYEVTSIEGDIITLRTTVKQDAANQKIQSPAMPGMKVDLTKLHSDGTGTSKIDLTKVSPVSGGGDIHSETSMGMNMGGQKQTMKMKMDMSIKVESK